MTYEFMRITFDNLEPSGFRCQQSGLLSRPNRTYRSLENSDNSQLQATLSPV